MPPARPRPAACIHCERDVRARDAAVTYPRSGQVAHLACVSLPSFDETDELLLVLSLLR
jgi:hypothetical protein